ncbi:RNA polymerase sigma factor, partial [Anaerobacillus sp. MEB173]|uniref:RNA polymerase sigma factor n=1 Tax=Anaerobacillus sp. MEB173 TaxID=3383345 RepID=UPI003F9141ED
KLIFEMFYQKVYQRAFFMTRNPHLSQDITQETFIKAFKNLHKVEDGKKIESWLITITIRTTIDFLRKEKRWNDFTAGDVYIDETVMKDSIVELQVEQRFMKSLLQSSISILKPEYKDVLLLKYDCGLKDKEIALALEVNVGTVKSRIHRSKLKLKAIMESYLEDGKEGSL